MKRPRNVYTEDQILAFGIRKQEFSHTHSDIAKAIPISPNTLWKWRQMYSGFPKGIHFGHSVCVRPMEARAWLLQHRKIDIEPALERREAA